MQRITKAPEVRSQEIWILPSGFFMKMDMRKHPSPT